MIEVGRDRVREFVTRLMWLGLIAFETHPSDGLR
jgi:hypothetical protein